MAQLSFASLDYAAKKKRTKRDVFLAEMAAVVPWVALEALIEPHYPKAGPSGGRRPFPLAVMLRIYCLQQWYNLSDPGAEEVLYDICSMRTFAGLELGRDTIPDETTILNFRHLLERHELTKAIFVAIAEFLETRGALLRGGTIIDATLIAASPSTKNKAQKRDPEMRSSKKGNQWYFGMKAHIGVDATSGLVHTAGVTTGSVHDAKVMDNLIREDDRAVYGDKGYANDRKQRQAEAAGVLWAVKAKAKPGRPLSISQRRRNRRFGKIRAKVEHVFRVMKCQFGYRKVRYRGIAKNGAQVFALLALANLFLARRNTCVRLTKSPGECRPRQVQTKNPSPPTQTCCDCFRKSDVAQRFLRGMSRSLLNYVGPTLPE
jgi:transposase, IS5 family